MARKIQLISELADQTAREVTRDAEAWKRYLDTASRLYKYSFDDQLLIYAQNPDATACAAMGVWNDKMRRWVKAGSKGIALIHGSENGRPHLEYVFDVSATRPVHGARMPYLWEMRSGHHAPVLATLEARYGKCDGQDMGSCLMETAARAVEEVYTEYLHDMIFDGGEDSFGGLDRQDMEACFCRTLTASVQYTLLVRCGLEPSDYLDNKALDGIQVFSTPAVLHHLGNAASTLSMGILQEIGRAVRTYDKEQMQNPQKNMEKQLEKTEGIGYTKGTEQFSTLKRESKERSKHDGGVDIHKERGLSDTGPDAGRGGRNGGNAGREIRAASSELSEGTAPRDIHVNAADREADAAPVPDRPAGTGTDRQNGGGDDATERSGRGAQGTRPDGVAPGGEQLHGTGGGDSATGDRVQVRQEQINSRQNHKETETAGGEPAVSASFQLSLFPTVEEQAERIAGIQSPAMEGFEPAKGSFVTEEEIDSLLTRGSGVSEGKMRIYAYFVQGHDAKECAAFLRNEYGNGGHRYTGYDEWHDSRGIRFTRSDGYSASEGHDTVKLNWNQVQKRIRRLIDEGKYLNAAELAHTADYEKSELARKLYAFFRFDPRVKPRQEWDADAAERDFRPLLDLPKYCDALYEDMVEAFALMSPEDSRVYAVMSDAIESMAEFQRGEYSLFSPLPEEKLQRERAKREQAEKAEIEENNGPVREKEPAGELEAAARALAKKQKGNGKVKERQDGQLAFDFAVINTDDNTPVFQTMPEEVPEKDKKTDIKETIRTEESKKTETDRKSPAKTELERESHVKMETDRKSPIKAETERNTPVILYREILHGLVETVHQSGMDKYLSENYRDYEEAAKELDGELDYFIDELAESQPEVYSAFQSLPMFRQWMVEDILEYTYQDISDGMDAIMRHSGEPNLPEWAKEAVRAAVEEKADEQSSVETTTEKIQGSVSDAGKMQNISSDTDEVQNLTPDTEEMPNLTPDVKEYLKLKIKYPDKLIGVEIDGYYLFYGKDAQTAARILGTKLIVQEIPGLGKVAVTGGETWQSIVKKLLEHGQSALIAGPDPEQGKNAPYRIIKDCDIADYIPLRMQLTIDGRRMEVDSIDYENGNVSLRDLDLKGWFPVFRSEPVWFVRGCVEKEWEMQSLQGALSVTEVRTKADTDIQRDNVPVEIPVSPGVEQKAESEAETAQIDTVQPENSPSVEMAVVENTLSVGTAKNENIFSTELAEIEGGQVVTAETESIYSRGLPYDIVVEKIHFGTEPHNYRITDDALGTGGQKSKYQDNIAAIKTLKQTEAENRLATPEEQAVMAKYVGWGGLAQAFDPDNEKWSKEYAELKELLTPQEYESARSTVLNAHYTSPVVIRAVYEAVSAMDFTPGNILEPSCGIGNFFGLVPEKYNGSNLYGVELDSLTGRIAGQLYQKADITIGGFEKTEHPDDFFDLAIGNVPFGEYKVHDKRYDKQNLLIHDYFLTKALDKVRPGGVMAFITTKGTMDKANSRVREALAKKADLLGAVRLPNNAFKANAGTDVTSDILFFQKRGSAPEKLPDWVNIGQTDDGVPLNNYFLRHPEMVLGKMSFYQNMYGNETETACLPIEGADLAEQLSEAVRKIAPPDRELLHMDVPEQEEKAGSGTIPADPDVRNFSFTEKGGKLYFRENSRMTPVETGKTPEARIKGMIGIRDSARKLIDLQLNGAGEEEIRSEQERLNHLYDSFQKKYGLLNSAGNRLAFRQDSSYPLLCSLEVLDGEGNLKRKADMFTKRTIRHRQPVTSVDTAVEALGVSIGERACVDLGFMASLMGGSDKIPQVVSDLNGIIFKDPETGPFDPSMEGINWYQGWQTADEYLSGNVRQKLETARKAAEEHPEFAVNVEALEKVQPKDLTAPEISVRVGAPWIDTKYYKQFLFNILQTPRRLQDGKIDVMYSDVTGEWRLKGKQEDSKTNSRVWNTYGTKRVNAYEIFEAGLNQRSVQIFDTVIDAEGRESRVLNEKETAIAQQKQEALKEAFHDWIFKDPERRSDLCATYNRLFNSTRPREYDGQHISFTGMNPEIRLEKHQRNAVARVLYGKNTLLAHVVGAGKTFEITAAAMESKRLGLCKKSMIVVPNHLTEQWGGDFLTLYPGANVLVATKKDFEPKNRRKFCARISTGDYDAVIIGHSQFEKIPISPERQEAVIQDQIDEIVDAIAEAKAENEEKFTIKQMEKTKKSLEAKLEKLYDKKKDDTVYFEELGVDRLFVDEAHAFKNLFMHTKMRNVAGISQTDAQKSSDMFAKCRYMDAVTGGRGVTFATGTPVSNSMVELYTMMRYLQYDMLEQGYRDSTGKMHSLKHFDNWAATFGEQVTAVELKPEGTGFRLKTRFARFYNLPELMSSWKEAADIQTADMLKLPVPEAEYITVQTEPSEAQKLMVKDLAERAEKIRKERIDPRIDNMLKVTSDGRKLALDQRIMNPLLPDDPGSKVNACVDNVFKIWQESTPQKGTQLIFSDLSTPKGRAEPDKGGAKNKAQETSMEGETAPAGEETAMEASVYEDIRKKLVAKGIPAEQIAFIHSANTDMQKAELFAKVRSGQVRVLLGSTQKMGAGTNVQTKLVASHDLDCPWVRLEVA